MAKLEIERKFLIDGFPALEPLRCAEVEQGYLCHEPVVRIRRSSEGHCHRYKLCFKGKGTLVRTEMEMDLTAEQYEQLYDLLPEATIKKVFRTYQLASGDILECSQVDPGEPTSFVYAEVEFPSEEAAAAFEPPAFLGRDVTEEPGFTMSHYAKVKREKGAWRWATK